jgi:hypothetical protein
VWGRLTHIESQEAVEAVERFADNVIAADILVDARHQHRSCGAWRIQRNAAEAVSQASLNPDEITL